MTGEDLKALRIRLGLTQKEMAKSIGTNRYKVSHWEAERNKISPAYQAIIQEKYKAELDNKLMVREKQK